MFKKWVFLIILVFAFSSYTDSDTIVFSPLQFESSGMEYEKWVLFVEELGKRLNINIEFKQFKDNKELLNDVVNDKIGISYLCPFTYVLVKEKNPQIVPLYVINISEKKYKYRCVLFTVQNSIKTDRLDKRMTFALVSPYATCGYLSADYLYKKMFKKEFSNAKFDYLGSHNKVINSVIAGKYDYGCTNSILFEKYSKIFNLKKVIETPELPGFVLVANRKLINDELYNKLKISMKEVFEQPAVKNVNPYGVNEISDKDYDIIRKMKPKYIPFGGLW
ncbi:MAG: PhnD/SsuA/transferrin family substrate-binding protein [Calditerrivibrio sp.]|nr:PhnD/SsuA/transferrin family substrate-binding protein [Calditerrivibrio sp.]